MDDRNALAIVSAIGEVAFKAALRAIAMLLITFVALAVLAGAAIVASAIEAAQEEVGPAPEIAQPVEVTQPAGPAEDILLMPAQEPNTRM